MKTPMHDHAIICRSSAKIKKTGAHAFTVVALHAPVQIVGKYGTDVHTPIQTVGKYGTDVHTPIQTVIQTVGKHGTDVQTVDD
jgi:hypothetical protein